MKETAAGHGAVFAGGGQRRLADERSPRRVVRHSGLDASGGTPGFSEFSVRSF